MSCLVRCKFSGESNLFTRCCHVLFVVYIRDVVYFFTALSSVLAIAGWWLISSPLIHLARGGPHIIPRGSVCISECREVQGRVVIVQAALFYVPSEIRTGLFPYVGDTRRRLDQFSLCVS